MTFADILNKLAELDEARFSLRWTLGWVAEQQCKTREQG